MAGAFLFGTAIAVVSDGHLNANWALQGGFVFFLLHSLRWNDAEHAGAGAGRNFIAILWAIHAFVWMHCEGTRFWMPFIPGLLVLAVTVLTSLDDVELGKIGLRGGVLDQVLRLTALALSNGCKGVVASAHEAGALRHEFGREFGDFAIVTPGVRPAGSGHDDQARVVTPAEAIAAGSSHIVVGRPITTAADPAAEARAILAQIGLEAAVRS